MEKGWKAREDLKFKEAEKLLKEARKLFEQEKDWFNVTEAMNHLAYLKKTQSVHHNLEGLDISQEAAKVADKHNIKKLFVLRALMSLASSAGNFERALNYGMEALPLYKKPADRADILSHIATFQLRTGKMKEAQKTIKEAESLFKKGKKDVGEPHRTIWESKMMLTKAMIMYNKGSEKKSKKMAEKALGLAKKHGLKTRIKEIEAFLEVFE